MSATESTFYVTGGTLRHNAPSCVERMGDKDLRDAGSRKNSGHTHRARLLAL